MAQYKESRREAIIAGTLWLLAMVWTVGVSVALGYNGNITTVFGIPRWIAFGVFLPWIVFFVAHAWFTLRRQ